MKCVVTGGNGFLGSALCRALVERGDEVVSIARKPSSELPASITQIAGDIRDLTCLEQAFADATVVFHVAAKAGAWGKKADFESINVEGTRNVLRAAKSQHVRALVHTSTPSVVACDRDLEGVDESFSYPDSYDAHYPRTKAIAEREVLSSAGELSCVALRPHLIWGPGDTQLIPRLVARRRQGRLRRVGDGRNRVDISYIDDVVAAHLLAATCLLDPERSETCRGRAYFVSGPEPVNLWETVDAFLAAGGEPAVEGSISMGTAVAVGAVAEGIWRVLALAGEPPMTRWVARELGHAHWFSNEAAKRDLGYEAKV